VTGDPFLDPDLAEACARAGLARDGLSAAHAASDGTAACVVVITDRPPGRGPDSDAVTAAVRTAVARRLGPADVDLIIASGGTQRALVRDWLYQAAQGSGRGVSVRLEEHPVPGARPVLTVLVDSADSSAREVALRLAGPLGRLAREALAGALGFSAVDVRDTSTP
jgi:hypothetical protein